MSVTSVRGVVVLAVLVRLLVAVITQSWDFPDEDTHWAFGYEMGRIAASIAEGQGFGWPDWNASVLPEPEGARAPGPTANRTPGPTAWMAPVYPYLIAGAFRAFGVYSTSSAIWMLFLQTMVAAATCFLLYTMGTRLYDRRTGLAAAFLFAVYPASIHYSVQKVWSATLLSFLLLLIARVLLDWRKAPGIRWGAHLGLLFGFAALVDPTVLSVLPLALLWLFRRRVGLATLGRSTIALALVAALTVSPWLARNYVVFGEFVFVKSNLGHELYIGNASVADEPLDYTSLRGDAEYARLWEMGELAGNRAFRDRAVEAIRADPLRFLRLTATRIVKYWTIPTRVRGAGDILGFVAFAAVLGLAVSGYLRDRSTSSTLLLLFLVAIPLPYYVTIVAHYRYRFPIEPIVILLAARRLSLGWEGSRLRRPRGGARSGRSADARSPCPGPT